MQSYYLTTKKYHILLPEKDVITLIQVAFGQRELQFLTSFEEPNIISQLIFIEHLHCESNCRRIHQFSSVTQSCPTLCSPVDCSTPGFPVHHQPPEFTQTHVHYVSGAIHISSSVVAFSSCLQSFPASGSFSVSQFFPSGGQSIGVSALASFLPKNIQY